GTSGHPMYVDQVLVEGNGGNLYERATLAVDDPMTIGDLNLFSVADGTISANSSISSLELGYSTTATFNTTSTLVGSLAIADVAVARVATHSGSDPNVLTVNSLSIDSGGRLDLTNNLLLVDYS